MTTVAEFAVPSGQVPSRVIFERLPDMTVELERIVPTEAAVIPYAWIHGVDAREVEEILERFPEEKPHPGLREIELIDEVNGDFLLRFEWLPDVDGLLRAVAESDVVLVSGVGTAERWRIEVRGEDRAAVSAFQTFCVENDVPVELTSLHALTRLRDGADHVLTDAQREALVLAYDRGYFRSPRESTLEEIAEELEITGQSLGSRLRRGIERLLADALIDRDDAED